MSRFDYDSIDTTTLAGLSCCLSGKSAQLLLNTIQSIKMRYQWEPITDGQWDTLESLIAETEGALMNNCSVGMIVHLATDAAPANVLWCDGSSYDRVDYPELYAVLADAFIDDADTFTLPDLRDTFIMNIDDDNSEIGNTGGNATTTLTAGNLPPHTHTYNRPTSNVDVESVGIPDPTGVGIPFYPANTGNGPGSSDSFSNLPPYLKLKTGIICR